MKAKNRVLRLNREFFVECGRRGGKKRMKMLAPAERRAFAAAAVRKRKWRGVEEIDSGIVTVRISMEDRFWDTLDLGRELLPER